MNLQKLAVKIFTVGPDRFPLREFIDVFHGWIQATDGVYHDVADYSHMQAGPGVVVVAGSANVGIDDSGNRRGLLFTQKSVVKGSNAEVLKIALCAALENCRKLENDAKLKGELKFSGKVISFAVNDRLLGPNTDAAFAELRPEIEAVARALFAGAAFTLHRDQNPRKRLNVTLIAERPFDAAALLGNMQCS